MTNPAGDNGAGTPAGSEEATPASTPAGTNSSDGATASEAFNSKAWLQHYTPWTQHTIDLDDPAENPAGFTIPEVFWHAVDTIGERNAFTFFGKVTTYEEYGHQVAIASQGLKKLGVQRGDHVAIALPNCPQALIAFFAIQNVGAVPILHNPLYTAAELHHPFNDHGAKVAFFWDKVGDVAEQLRLDSPLDTVIAVTLPDEMPAPLRYALKLPIPKIKAMKDKLTGPAPAAFSWKSFMRTGGNGEKWLRGGVNNKKTDPTDPALILYTSGTTGQPKGAVLTHRNLVANLRQGQAWVKGLGKGPKPEVMLAALPIFHAYGLTMNITLAPMIGGEIQLLPAPEMPLVMRVMKKNMPSWMPGVPALYQNIMKEAAKRDMPLSGIRNSFSGASALPAETVREWESSTGGNIVEGYGLTETSPIIAGNPMGKGREGYIGVPFPSTEIRVANPDNPAETMPDGEAGELVVRGPQVFKGYLNRPDATADAFYEDWFRTGDMAVMESDGYLKIVSRIKEMIITGGFNVYPAEVEEVLCEHPSIEQASVVGVQRKDGSETVAAAVVLANGAVIDADDFRDFAKKRLTAYKVPKVFHAFQELPADQLGKVRRREVQELVAEKEQA